MNTLMKRDRAILEYMTYHYGKETVKALIADLRKDIQQDNNLKNNNKD